MKRTAALQPLSRDHHQALFVAQRLRRATADTAPQACQAFLEFWRAHGRHHFRCEEEILLPTYAGVGDPRHPLVVNVLVDHLVIRQAVGLLEHDRPAEPEMLRQLGTLLSNHVRLEERELFPLIEETLPEAELEALAATLAQAEEEDCA